MSSPSNVKKGWAYWLSFAGATYAMSQVFSATRALTSADVITFTHWSQLALWVSVLVLVMTFLAYQAYKLYKADGKLTRTVGLFERLYAFEHRET